MGRGFHVSCNLDVRLSAAAAAVGPPRAALQQLLLPQPQAHVLQHLLVGPPLAAQHRD